jgi:hypothetical protein
MRQVIKNSPSPGAQRLSFTPEEFAAAYLKGDLPEHMIDELIMTGYCVMDWIQANVPQAALDHGIIAQVPLDEDEEPEPLWYGMSFNLGLFKLVATAAAEELMRYKPWQDYVVDALPGSDPNSQNIRLLKTLLDDFVSRSICLRALFDTDCAQETLVDSPLFMAMVCESGLGAHSLSEAIRTNTLVQLSFRLFEDRIKSGHRSEARKILKVPILNHHIPRMIKTLEEAKDTAAKDFVNSLPTVAVDSISKEDMRCALCWCDFDEPAVEGTDNTPVVAPCGSACPHRFGRDCMVNIVKSASLILCPLCRQPLGFEMPECPFD